MVRADPAWAAILATAATLIALAPASAQAPAGDWRSTGREVAGTRASPLGQITPANVARLANAWTFELKPADNTSPRLAPSNQTPLAIDGVVYIATPYNRLVAIDGDSGATLWTYQLPEGQALGGRGIEYWAGDAKAAARIFLGTREGLMLAVDVKTGKAAAGFTPIDLKTPAVMAGFPRANYQINSSPTLYKDVLITASRLQESPPLGPNGDVRGWDARTGKLLWTFHSIPQPGEPFHDSWGGDSWKQRSGVNVWTLMSVDEKRGIAYLPFGAPAYDRIGIDRPGSNLFSDSLVAVDARTGKYLWHYQTVHHDIWDLDLPMQPALFDVKRDGRTIPAVAVSNKSGYVFILDRVTGKPIFPTPETPVAASTLPGEHAWPTQPIPSAPPPLIRQTITAADITTVTPAQTQACLDRVANEKLTFDAPFTPLRGDHPTVRMHGSGGGPNWGGAAFDTARGYLIVNTSEEGSVEQMGQNAKGEWYNNTKRNTWWSVGKLMCQPPPWGTIAAIDVSKGTIAWQVPLGITDSLPEAMQKTGRPNVGGPTVTASGLIFIGASDDSRFRAFDLNDGRELWTVKLPASAHSTPIVYRGKSGRQYVSILAAGGSYLGDPVTASQLITYALPREP
ncbi:PQQ-binding-like beta-propeller repeat protein [Glacieibacterium sp.]|uniref:outer membrane protein assembly factor BamB family protein n=1 Tax=Glacieibacterium sp. TaxID=2860237 RepID=UPI003B00EB12